MPRFIPLLAGCCAAVLALAGCSSDKPAPNYSSVTPTPSASITPTTSPSATPNTTANVPEGAVAPTLPASAQTDNSDGAFAFVSFYWAQVDWAYSTVNGDVLSGLYMPTCKSCASSRTAINQVRSRGHAFAGGHLTIKSQTVADASDDASAQYAIDTRLQIDTLKELTAGGEVTATYPAQSYTVRAFVAWADGKFQLTATSNLAGG